MYRGNWSPVVGYCVPRLSLYRGVGLRLLVTASIGCLCTGGIALMLLVSASIGCLCLCTRGIVYCISRLSLYRGNWSQVIGYRFP